MLQNLQHRLLTPDDSVEALTHLLHRAYKPLLDMGLHFWATSQSVEETRKRIEGGQCYVASLDGNIVGTILYYPPERCSGSPWYDRRDVAGFGQFAVEPSWKRTGLGRAMLENVEMRARSDGAAELALDTSERAAHLIRYYETKGYRFIEHAQWERVNYRSVILSKTL